MHSYIRHHPFFTALKEFGQKGKGEKKLTLLKASECISVDASGKGFVAKVKSNKDGRVTSWESPLPIVLATGFSLRASPSCVLHGLTDWDDTGRPILSLECDEVKKTEGLFCVGPFVQHVIDLAEDCVCDDDKDEEGKDGKDGKEGKEGKDGKESKLKGKRKRKQSAELETIIFCFIYKFRCR